MDISYTYEVVSVDETARSMEVVYSAEGHQTLHIGARLPYQGEPLEDVIAIYAPINNWREQQMPLATVSIGSSGSLSSATDQAQSAEQDATRRRNQLLYECDWTQLADVPLSAEQKSAWAAYRQALRDITDQAGFPENVSWPQRPGIPVAII